MGLQLPPLEEGFIYIFHPQIKQAAAIHPDALGQHYAQGWRRLVADDLGEDGKITGLAEPEPVTVSQAAALAGQAAAAAGQAAAPAPAKPAGRQPPAKSGPTPKE